MTPEPFVESIKNADFFNKSQDCTSCGIQLQTIDPESEGYYIQPRTTQEINDMNKQQASSSTTYRSHKSSQFLSAFSKLDNEGRSLLTNQDSQVENEVIITSKKSKSFSKNEPLTCKRCHDALHHSQYDTDKIQSLQLSQILEPIPVKSSIYHVFAASDFPLSLLNLPARRGDIKFIMNKTDMLFAHGSTIDKYDNYFKHIIKRLTGLKNSSVYMVSAHSNWGIKTLLGKLKDDVMYLVGYVNTGKTKLAQRIESAYTMKSDNKKLLGSSHFPALTRDEIEHKLSSRKSLIDTPGLITDDNSFKHIKQEHLKNLTQGKKLIITEMRKERYHSARDGQIISIAGGLILLRVPNGTIVQAKNATYGVLRNFQSIDKAIEVLQNQPDALEKSIFVKPESIKSELQRYVIPPFKGTIDLLVKDLGFVQIKPTGRINENSELFEVFAPKGIILGARETIEHFLTGYIKQYDTKEKKHYHKGEVVKITKSEKLRFKPKTIPDYKIFTQLYQIPLDCDDPQLEMKRQFEELQQTDGYERRVGKESRDLSRNKFWIEKL